MRKRKLIKRRKTYENDIKQTKQEKETKENQRKGKQRKMKT